MEVKYFANNNISGRYITIEDVEVVLKELCNKKFEIQKKAQSVENRNLYTISFGKGAKKVIVWSHMHGNEGTTTKALLDWLTVLNLDEKYYQKISSNYTICVLPMVNPDGAYYYTRNNANDVDLNRDAKLLSQKESVFLRKEIESFSPDLALNLHDQRTIFGVGDTGFPATISFLAPAFDADRNIDFQREKTMKIIGAVVTALEKIIPNQIGRFDDFFNINCIGDYNMHLKIPTILFEAGHYPNDYQREITRKIVFEALFSLFEMYFVGEYEEKYLKKYLEIQENTKNFADICVKNVGKKSFFLSERGEIFVQYKERVQEKRIVFDFSLDLETAVNPIFAHKYIDAEQRCFFSEQELYEYLLEKIENHPNEEKKIK